MPADRLAMHQIKELLRLRHVTGLSVRGIAHSLDISVGVVSKYLHLATRAGVTWPLPADWDEAALLAHLQPPAAPVAEKFPAPDFAAIHQALRRKGVTLQLLWEEYAAAVQPATPYCYSHFCVLYRAWQQRLAPTLRQTHTPGEKLFVDYAGPTIPLHNAVTGEVTQAQLFVAVLGASNYTYAEATHSQQLPDWIGSHVRAFAFFGGVPRLVVPDNLKSGVRKACRYEPVLTRTYAELLAHYGTAALPARPYKPRDKAKVEAGVQLVERWILARLRHHTFFSLAEINQAIRPLLARLNQKPFKKLAGSRLSQFTEVEQAALLPLPATPYEYAEWKTARVHVDYHIEVDGHYYSVPHTLLRRPLDVRLTATTVECFLSQQRVAVHPRDWRKGRHSTLPEHMPKSHRAHREWSPERLQQWAAQIGPATRELVTHLLTERPHPEQGYRACLGLLNCAKRFGEGRLEAACQRALALYSPTRRCVLSILENGLDTQPLPEPTPDFTLPAHDNLRGAAYYH